MDVTHAAKTVVTVPPIQPQFADCFGTPPLGSSHSMQSARGRAHDGTPAERPSALAPPSDVVLAIAALQGGLCRAVESTQFKRRRVLPPAPEVDPRGAGRRLLLCLTRGNKSTEPAGPALSGPHLMARLARKTLRDRLADIEHSLGHLDSAGRIRGCEQGTYRFDLHSDEPAPLVDLAGRPIATMQYCDHRLCPRCVRRRAAHNRNRIEPALRVALEDRKPSLVTLTQRARVDEPLQEAADRLLAGWQKLRRREGWKSRVKGALLAIEVTRNVVERWYHVHLHVLVDCSWYAQPELLADWRDALGLEGVDDKGAGANIQRVRGGLTGGLFEAIKYVTKGISSVDDDGTDGAALDSWDDEHVRELLVWLRGRRTTRKYGTFYNVHLNDDEDVPDLTPVMDPEWAADTDNPVVGVNAVTGRVVRESDATYLQDDEISEAGWSWLDELFDEHRASRRPGGNTS